ncbi:MAG: RNHCP domain-containing protein [Candidatus Protochlamydia sp.]|nr:RNHCP domain-containing protein [Candidatus Protochlamydia sp.]
MRLQHGSYRNHCPFCLSSLHVDEKIPGDRKSSCQGIMKASQSRYTGKKGWQIVHVCLKCGQKKLNLIAEGDVQSDDWSKIIELS